jgi:hypothetical protein
VADFADILQAIPIYLQLWAEPALAACLVDCPLIPGHQIVDPVDWMAIGDLRQSVA